MKQSKNLKGLGLFFIQCSSILSFAACMGRESERAPSTYGPPPNRVFNAISGEVTADEIYFHLKGIKVTLKRGDTEIASTFTDFIGKYSFNLNKSDFDADYIVIFEDVDGENEHGAFQTAEYSLSLRSGKEKNVLNANLKPYASGTEKE